MEMNLDFGFGYNDSHFSDRILHILILSDDKLTSGSKPDENEDYGEPPCGGQFQNAKGDEASDKNEKICEDGDEASNDVASCKPGDKPTSGYMPGEHEDCIKPVCDNQLPNSNEVSMQIRSRPAIQTAGDKASQQNETSAKILQQKSVCVNSLILAAHSPFFRKLFSNGMKESGQEHATIHILASEEDAFMDLIKFMYSGELLRDTPSGLRDVIMAADKYSVASCIKLCGQLLINLPMTLELALLYLDLDFNGLMMDSVRPHLDTAKGFIVEHFKDLNNAAVQEELLELPLVGVEAVLSSDYLQVQSEDDIYDFMLKWTHSHCSDHWEERTILNTLVRRFLRFPFLSTKTLESIMTCSDIDPAISSELALGALRYYKAEPPQQQTPDKFRKRAYTNPPLKGVVVDSSSSHPLCVIYLDLKRDECENIPRDSMVVSQTFFLGEHQFSLCVCHFKNTNNTYSFGLFFVSSKESTASFRIACDIVTWEEPSAEFVRRTKGTFVMDEGSQCFGSPDVFGVPWDRVISKDSPYFRNNVLHLRCDLRIKK